MAVQWFYQSRDGQPSGPVDSTELSWLAAAGIVRPDTLVRQGDTARWVRADQVRGLFQRPTPAPSVGPSPPGPPPLPPPVAHVSTSQVRREAELARRRRADRDPLGLPPVQEATSVSGVESEKEREGRAAVLEALGVGGGACLILVVLCIVGTIADSAQVPSALLDRFAGISVLFAGCGIIKAAYLLFSTPWTLTRKVLIDLWRNSRSGSPPSPLPLPSAVPESGTPGKGVGGQSRIRHGLRAAAVNDESKKFERIWPALWAAIIVGSGATLLLLWALVFRGGSAAQQDVENDQPRLVATQWGEPEVLELADLVEIVEPSVVQVNVTGPEEAATGSGFVLDKQGTIVTNYHVIEDATAGTIVFCDRTSVPITGYLGVWPEKDIALVRVKCPPEKLHPLHLATSTPPQGERVVAFGSPLGTKQSVSEGIVSAVRESKELRTLGPFEFNTRFIQTTTAISHRNSGGPLVDMKGMVVGVNMVTFQPLGGKNVNFAVAAVELPPLRLANNEIPSPLPASNAAADGVRPIRRAFDHLFAGEYDRAIADFTEIIRLEPKNADAYQGRGVAYRLKDDYDGAIADFTKSLQLDPKSADAYCVRGWAYFSKGDYERAINDFTEAVRLDPKCADAYFRRGGAWLLKDDYDRAIADFTEVIRLEPKNADAYGGRCAAHGLKGQQAAAERDFAKAKELGYKP